MNPAPAHRGWVNPPKELFDILKEKGVSPFRIKVYQEVCAIPCGETRSYRWVARRLKKAKSARAVGQALKKNPFPLIIPCHRVIRADGTPGGFSGGKGLKKRLLESEKIAIIEKK